MSLIVMAIGGAAGLWHYQRNSDFAKYRLEEENQKKTKPVVAKRPELSTGAYTDISQYANMVKHGGFIVAEEYDTDLTGAPCRWLVMRNGTRIKTYDLQTDYIGDK